MPFGQYLLLKRLAVGGMAELYLAKDTKTDKLVVIKRILPYLAQEREFVQMFLDEARIASQLHHPNIITVFELGHLEGSIFISMEFVEGVDLRKIFNEEQKHQRVVPPNIAAWLTSRLCDGLNYAHNAKGNDGRAMGIIHRDVSPQNLMVGYRGEVKLVDFGIAKAASLMERSKPGVIKGKFLYLSPEQLSQDRIDHRADIFALGTMMYEVTTGKSPFYKATTEAVIYAIRAEEPPPPHLSRRDFPIQLSKIIMKCLVKDRTRRYQQAGEVHADLEAWMKAEARTTVEDVRNYVARVFGNDDERTSLFIPPNAMGPSDRLTDRVASLRSASGTDSVRVAKATPSPKAAPAGKQARPDPDNETTKPIAPIADVATGTAVTAPIGRRPTPEPMRTVAPTQSMRSSQPALQPVPATRPSNPSNPSYPSYDSSSPEPSTQTARPQDLARAFNAGGEVERTAYLAPGGGTAPPVRTSGSVGKLPERKPSGSNLKQAGASDPNMDPTSLSDSGRINTSDILPSLTPITADVRPISKPPAAAHRPAPEPARAPQRPAARMSPGPAPSPIPEGIRQTMQPPPPQPAPRASLGEVPRVARPAAAPPRAMTADRAAALAPTARPQAVASPQARAAALAPTARPGAVPAPQTAAGARATGIARDAAPAAAPRKPTRAETGAVFDVPQQFARDEIPRKGSPLAPPVNGNGRSQPMVPTLPPEPSTKSERPHGGRQSQEDLGPLLDEAIPSLGGLRPGQGDDDDDVNTKDIGRQAIEMANERAASMDQNEDENLGDDPPGLAQRPWLVAGIVFVLVLGVGLGGLALYRSRASKQNNPVASNDKGKKPPAPDDPKPPPEPVAKKDPAPPPPEPKPTPPAPPPPPEVSETTTIAVKFEAVAGTRIIDQRDDSQLAPNTAYRWHPGRHPIIYSCPVKPKHGRTNVTYYVEVKPSPAEQSFPISCK